MAEKYSKYAAQKVKNEAEEHKNECTFVPDLSQSRKYFDVMRNSCCPEKAVRLRPHGYEEKVAQLHHANNVRNSRLELNRSLGLRCDDNTTATTKLKSHSSSFNNVQRSELLCILNIEIVKDKHKTNDGGVVQGSRSSSGRKLHVYTNDDPIRLAAFFAKKFHLDGCTQRQLEDLIQFHVNQLRAPTCDADNSLTAIADSHDDLKGEEVKEDVAIMESAL